MGKRIIALGIVSLVALGLSGCAHATPSGLPTTPSTSSPPSPTSPSPSRTPSSPPALDGLEILPSALGSLKIGEPITGSDMVVFDPTACVGLPGPEAGRWVGNYGAKDNPSDPFWVALGPENVLLNLTVFDASPKTARGIHVGSTIDELRAAYPALVDPGRRSDRYSSLRWVNWTTGRLTFEVLDGTEVLTGGADAKYVPNTVGSITISPVSNEYTYAFIGFDGPCA